MSSYLYILMQRVLTNIGMTSQGNGCCAYILPEFLPFTTWFEQCIAANQVHISMDKDKTCVSKVYFKGYVSDRAEAIGAFINMSPNVHMFEPFEDNAKRRMVLVFARERSNRLVPGLADTDGSR